MYEHYGHSALPDGGGNPLGRLCPRVAGDENTGNAGLQVIRGPIQRPAPRLASLDAQVGAGYHEAALIPDHDAVQPVGQRRRADEEEKPLRAEGLRRCLSRYHAGSGSPDGRCRRPR